MTRFALCAAVHTRAAELILPEEFAKLAPAVGFAFARMYAIFKNSRRFGGQERSNRRLEAKGREGEEMDGMKFRIAGFDVMLQPEYGLATILLNNRPFVTGSVDKGVRELSKVSSEILQRIYNEFPPEIADKRKVFEFYRLLRDEIGI